MKIVRKLIGVLLLLSVVFSSGQEFFYASEVEILTEEVIDYLSREDYVKAYEIAEEEGIFNKGYSQEELDAYFTKLYIRMYENKVRQRLSLPEAYNELNSAEKRLALIYPTQAAGVYMCSNEAERTTIAEYGYSNQDDCSNAFKHAFWNALMTNYFASSESVYNLANGRAYAKMWADAHEADNLGTLPCDMDLHNNNVGRSAVTRLSSSNELRTIIRNKVDSGACVYINNNKLCNTYDVD